MTTDGHMVDEAIQQGAAILPPHSVLEFNPAPYAKVTVYLNGDAAFDVPAVTYALEQFFVGQRIIDAISPTGPQAEQARAPQAPPTAAQRPQQGNAVGRPIQGQARGGSPFPSRSDKMPAIEGWGCDVCNGPVGLFETQNGGRLAKCLGTCKDPGGRNGYVHTVKDPQGELVFVPDDAVIEAAPF